MEGVAPISVTGSITVGDADGLDDIQSITIAGSTFDVSGGTLDSLVGESIDTGYGTLTITGHVDGQYSYTYTLNERVDNDSALGATDTGYIESIAVSVSDGATSASGSIDIRIADDTPEAQVAQAQPVNVDEAAIGTALGSATTQLASADTQGGADQPATQDYSLSVASSGVDSGLRTSSGAAVLLYKEGNDVVGRTADGTAVIELHVDAASGALTVTLLGALNHPAATSVLYMNSNVVFASVTVTDADGDTATDQHDVSGRFGFADSGPQITHVENASIDNLANLSVSGQVTAVAPDGVASWDLAPSLANAPAGITYTVQPDGSLVAKDATGESVFTLSIDAGGKYTFTLLKPAAEVIGASPSFSGLVLDAGTPRESVTSNLYASYDPQTGAGIGSPITTVKYTGNGDLNPSSDGLGIGDNLIDDKGSKVASDALSMQFGDDLSGASLHLGNLKNTDELVWKVYNNGVLVDSGSISGTYIGTDGQVHAISNSESPDYWIDLSRNGLDSNVLFDKLEIAAADGTAYKFIGYTVEKPVSVDDMELHFGVNAKDGDGDVSSTGGFTVVVDGTGSTIDDTVGDTVLKGGAGADVFKWTLAETGAHDTVADFNLAAPAADGDALDLHDLLPPESVGNLTSYLLFEDSGHGSTLLHISTAGGFTGDAAHDAAVAHQTIELQNVDLLSLGSDQQQIIDHLVNSGKLITD
jgi:hypothetical protein